MNLPRLAFVTLALTVGCSSSSFDIPEGTDASVEDATDTSVSLDTSTVDDTAVIEDTVKDDTSTVSDTGACDPSSKPDPAVGVFAAPTGRDDTGDGSALAPVRSIGAALEKAKALGRSRVYLDAGTYSESVKIGDTSTGVFVEGGWKAVGASWTRNCTPDARAQTVIASPTNTGVLVEAPKKPSGMRRLTITTKATGASPNDTPGESLIGVFVRGNGALFALEDVDVNAGDAGNGGVARNAAAATGTACLSSCGTGAPGTGGAGGPNAKIPGGYGFNGFTPADGSAGTKGGDGQMGTSGGTGTSGSCMTACTGSSPDCTTGAFCGAIMAVKSAGNGTCGCGGAGGGGGGQGRGGGASVAMLIIGDNVDVQLTNVHLKSGDGGDGSAGGSGADGAPGTAGKAGESFDCFAGCGRDTSCNCAGTGNARLTGGAAGGVGGTGGRGGNGGNGAGGPSYALVNIGTAQKVTTTSVFFAHGTGGTGSLLGTSGDRFP